MNSSGVRDVLALGVPTAADEALADLFTDQIITLARVVKDYMVPGDPVS